METIRDLGKFTFKALLENSVKKFGERPALSLVNETPVTYAQVAQKSIRINKFLTAMGIKKGSKVALYGTGRPEWGEAYFGIVNIGAIAVPLLPDFSETEVLSILKHCGVDAMIVEEKLYAKLKNIENELPPYVIKLENFSILKSKDEQVQKIDECDSVELPVIEIEEEDTASIIYTSGTTGRSKGVELTHKNLIWCAVQGQTLHRVNKMDRTLSFLPLSHVYEFTIGFTMQILNGACVYYLGKPPVISVLLPAFMRVKPTIVCSVPLIMEKIYKNKVLPTFEKKAVTKFLYKIPLFRKLLNNAAGKQLKKTFGGKIVFFGIGGSKVDPKVEQFMKEAKFPYAIGYGLTETAPLLAGSGPSITLPGTIGIPLEGVDLKINNPDPKTGIGEVVAKGPNVMKGYYKDPELTEANFTTEEDSVGSGYFKTGDLGILEKKHGRIRLSLKGRSKNMILGPSGENIYPEDIEFVLNQHPLVSESLVVEDDNGLVALVQVDEEKLKDYISKLHEDIVRDIAYHHQTVISEIQYFINSKVNKSSRISRIEEVKEFQKTASQKIKRYLYNLKNNKNSKK
ncbi:MAG: AMP-binding protein [Spirochaetia bacterium]|nr:AMP-binding protein [Spirochaetia bacterium]